MKEHNKKTLIEALSTLPEYEPPEALWEAIESKADEGQEKLFSEIYLNDLPEYSPPELVWENITKSLDKPAVVERQLVPGWRKALTVAASVGLIAFVLWYLRQASPQGEPFALSYSTENVDSILLVQDWDEDEAAFTDFLEICESKKYICEQPAFRQLQSELEELTEAKEELKAAIGGYGADAGLITQIKEIELERTDILKKLMVMLI